MKVLSVMRADSVCALRKVSGSFGYLPYAVDALSKRYGFIGLPTIEELTSVESKGLSFRRGKLETGKNLIPIDLLQILPNGISVSTHSNTTDSDLVLDHILEWSKSELKLDYEFMKPGIAHASQLEVRLAESLPRLVPILGEIGNAITEGLDDWWEIRPPYQLISLNFWHDKSRFPAIAPPLFRLDRRDSVPFEQEVYYAEAPMSTDNHITVLERLERICIENLKK